ncbi:hypothetical protein KFE25_007292 [Diacronema lutheri]|uniref:Uncharacterized protein n=1 Tax=Diacronema lutheri TaxID=2081491 RepID=A0A8J6CDN4_DIALT|nr:hypothetical protein KFE25_007292 [Diacronema lutheri]
MCGVGFEITTALTTTDLAPVLFDETSHEKQGRGIAFYAKVVGTLMHIPSDGARVRIDGAQEDAEQFAALLDMSGGYHRFMGTGVYMVGEDTIEFREESSESRGFTGAHIAAYICAGSRVWVSLQTMVIPLRYRFETVMDGIYLDAAHEDPVILPTFRFKGASGLKQVPITQFAPSLNALRYTGLDHATVESLAEPFKEDLWGALGFLDDTPSLITGQAGAGKTTRVAMGGLVDVVIASPSHLLRQDLKGRFSETTTHARLFGDCPAQTSDSVRCLEKHPPAVLAIDEATMLTQKMKEAIIERCAKWGTRLVFLGDFDPVSFVPMQATPMTTVSMNPEGLRHSHVPGQRRCATQWLVELHDQMRASLIRCDPPEATWNLVRNAFRANAPEQIVTRPQVAKMFDGARGDVILTSTRRCQTCEATTSEACSCKGDTIRSGVIDWCREVKDSGVWAASSGDAAIAKGTRMFSKVRPEGYGWTEGPATTFSQCQGLTVDAPARVFLDIRFLFKSELAYVGASRVRDASQLWLVDDPFVQSKRIGESIGHLVTKGRVAHELNAGIMKCPVPFVRARTEYPFTGSHLVADVACLGEDGAPVYVVEIVNTSPPSDDKLEFYESIGVECLVVRADRSPDTDLTEYIEKFPKPGDYTYERKKAADGSEYGRAYVKGCGGGVIDGSWRASNLQGCPRDIRKRIAEREYVDIDMVGAAPCIIAEVSRQLGVQTPTLRLLVDDVKAARARLADERGCSIDEAKLIFNKTLHGGGAPGVAHGSMLDLLAGEMRSLAAVLRSEACFEGLAQKARNDASLLSLVWQTLEHECLMRARAEFADDPRIVLVFDGMLVPRDILGRDGGAAILERVNESIRGLIPDLRMVVKPW